MQVENIEFIPNYTLCVFPKVSTPWNVNDYPELDDITEADLRREYSDLFGTKNFEMARPCHWISDVLEWAIEHPSHADILNNYVRSGVISTSLNDTIYQFPRIYGSTRVYLSVPELNERVTLQDVTSGSFGKHNLEGNILIVHVPKRAIVAYHPQDDKIIFPKGAQLYLISKTQAIYVGINTIWKDSSEYIEGVISNKEFSL